MNFGIFRSQNFKCKALLKKECLLLRQQNIIVSSVKLKVKDKGGRSYE